MATATGRIDSDSEDDKWEDWEGEDGEEEMVQSLFSTAVFPSLSQMVENDKVTFKFDLREALLHCQNEMESIMLVNYIRHWFIQLGRPVTVEDTQQLLTAIPTRNFCLDEKNMKPAMVDDALLYLVHNVVQGNNHDDDNDNGGDSELIPTESIETLKATIHDYQKLVESLLNQTVLSTAKETEDLSYFSGYSGVSIHETMLRDRPRMVAYGSALSQEWIKNKVVLDVGCGSGILCLFAARAQAKKVIGIENSLAMVNKARKIVEKNGFSSIISIVHGSAESIILPLCDNEKVDLVVSEWMGYGLYFENMLPSVLSVRDRYLATDGLVLPNVAKLYIAAMSPEDSLNDRVLWWKKVDDFDLTEMIDMLTAEAQVQDVAQKDLISNNFEFHSLDIQTAKNEDLDFECQFELTLIQPRPLVAFVLSFDTLFNDPKLKDAVQLSTTASAAPTHWAQTVLWLEMDNRTSTDVGDKVAGTVSYRRDAERSRNYIISVQWTHKAQRFSQKYTLAA